MTSSSRHKCLAVAAVWSLLALSSCQNIRTDPVLSGPALEIVHLFQGQWPTGIAVSSTGRKFACYPAGLDPANTNNGLNKVYQVSELVSNDTEVAYPSVGINNPPGGSINNLAVPPVTKGLSGYLLGVQSVVIDSLDTLWILDTGRVADLTAPNPMLMSSHGGPKLVAVNLTTNKVVKTIVFPRDVAYADSYPNDVRIDRSPKLSGIKGNQGAAYITDSSLEGRNGIIIVDIGTGESWRHLNNPATHTHPIPSVVPFVYGEPMYQLSSLLKTPSYITFGADGIALSPDGSLLYFSVIAGRFLYSVPTALLRSRGPGSGKASSAAVKNLGEKGISDGMETDSNGVVYAGNVEQDAISMYNPANKLGSTTFTTIFVRDPRINWVDTMSIATDGYLYFTVNQLNYLEAIYPGQGLPFIDRRQKPYVCFRAKLPNGGTKISP